ncbi:tyrosine--tRNA ligase [Candidatus Kaiserbacteria bacterium]|nr:tyrosine--tRNA ligase [Candidatus Kaiserbacteria bacterium]
MFGLQKSIDTNPKRIEEVLTRGVVEVIDTEHLRKKLLSGKRLRVKLGIDPTSPYIHLGRSVLLLKLKDFQDLGHRAVLIIGDTTGVIGDTSDKSSERPLLTKEEIKKNAATYFAQAGKILNIKQTEKHFNSKWLHALTYDDIGEHADSFSIADFIARENIKKRLDTGKRVSLREMLYPLMQGYDSVAVKADIEIGGTDQRFNLLAGRKLQERFKQEPQDILTTALILGIDGRKMSSSWGNTINILDEANNMYGKIMSIPDELIIPYFIHCTRISMARIHTVEEGMKKGENPRDFKMELARAIIELYHGALPAKSAEKEFVHTFQQRNTPDIPVVHARKGLLKDALLKERAVASGNEFNRLVAGGAISGAASGKITDPKATVANDTYKIGKRKFVAFKVE